MDKKQKRFKLGAQILIGGVIALVIAPIIYTIISGLAGIAAAIVIGGTAMALMPAFSSWLTALKFKSVKMVAEKFSIEILISREAERAEALNHAGEELDEQAASLGLFRKRVEQMTQDYPDEAVSYQEQLQEYEQLLAFRVDEYKEARAAHAGFQKVVEMAKYHDEMDKAAEATGKALGSSQSSMDKFKEKVALDAIDKRHYTAVAKMRRALDDQTFAREQIKDRQVRTINYTTDGRVELGNILKPIEVKALAA